MRPRQADPKGACHLVLIAIVLIATAIFTAILRTDVALAG